MMPQLHGDVFGAAFRPSGPVALHS